MAYTILDPDLETAGILSLEGTGCKFYDDLQSRKIADDQGKIWADTISLSVPYGFRETEFMTQGYHLMKQDENGKYRCYRIFDWEDDTIGMTHVKKVQAINLFAWDMWHRTVPPRKFSPTNSISAFNYIFATSGWELEDNAFYGGAKVLDISAGNNGMYWTDKLIKDYELEMDAYVIFYNGKVVRKMVDTVEKLGNDYGRRFEYAHDLQGITRKGNDQAMYTKLFVYGGNDKNGNPISIAPDNGGRDYIIDEDANDRYNNGGPYLEGYITNTDILNPSGLLDWGKKQMEFFNHPKYTYTVDVATLDFEPELGENITVLDFDMEPELALNARVIQLDKSEANPENNKVIVGEFTEITVVTPEEIFKLRAKASQAQQAAEKALGYKVEYFTPDGTDFDDTVDQKRIIIRVYQGRENVTTQIDEDKFTWLKFNPDGTHDVDWESRYADAGNVIYVGPEVVGCTIRCQVSDGISDPVIFATEEDAAYFATLQMDAPSGWTDYTRSVAQYAQVDHPRSRIYWSQKYYGSKKPSTDDANGIESYVITRTDLTGTPIDRMWCIRGGHGAQFGIEYISGQMWIWSYYRDVANNRWWVVKFPYTPNKVLNWGDASIVKMLNTGTKSYRTNLDVRNGYVLFAEGRTNPQFYVCKQMDIEKGYFKPAYSAKGSDINFFGTAQTYQSSALDFPYVYMTSGNTDNDYDQKVLYCFDITSKSLVYRIVYTFDKGTIEDIANHHEPEAISYYYDNTDKKWLIQGFAFGNEDPEDSPRTNQLYRINEHKRGDIV